MATPDPKVYFTSVVGKTERLLKANDKTLLALAEAAITQAKTFAPVNKKVGLGGQLKNSIQYRIGDGKEGGFNDSGGVVSDSKLTVGVKRGDAAIGATAEYAVYQEFGTRYMPPQPFLRPSLSIVSGKAPKTVQKEMDQEIKNWKAYFKREEI